MAASKAPAASARRWQSELRLAGKREKDWRATGERIIKRYRGEEKRANSFNILWANTEILRAALYNSRPAPDVRRRFRDEDPLGKAVSQLLERALDVVVDDASFDSAIKNDVLDSLLPGRAVSRIRYVPKITQSATSQTDGAEDDEDQARTERVEYEQIQIEHVDWQDLRIGYARTWDEVPWIAFRCVLTRDEAAEKFGADAISQVEFSPEQTEDDKPREALSETRKVAEFWEFWDKTSRTVFFTQEACEKRLFLEASPDGEPPLDLMEFFPIPAPLQMVENTGSIEPIPIYQLYEQQAKELDSISLRINKIVDACKLRGVRDAKLVEMADLMSAPDNTLVPVQNAQSWAGAGLDKAISWLPVEQAAKVLGVLTQARDQAKQTIYEITGISDIVRGATAASETATAQQIKANYASVRLQRMQREVQRYVRDLLRIAAEVIANKFAPETMAAMTNLQFPTAAQQDIARQQFQIAQSSGQPPDSNLQAMIATPTWEDIGRIMHNDLMRQFKVDVETDSTVASSIESDMKGIADVTQALGGVLQIFGPAVQMGFLPLEAAKEIALTVTRRARMGIAVEDALEKMQQPPPPPQPEKPPDNSLQVAQIGAQKDVQIAQAREQAETERRAAELQAQAQRDAEQKQHEVQLEQLRQEADSRRQIDEQVSARMIADADNQTKVLIAQIAADQARESQQAKLYADAQNRQTQFSSSTVSTEPSTADDAPPAAQYADVEQDDGTQITDARSSSDASSAHMMRIEQLISSVGALTQMLGRPRQVMRDDAGRIVGIQ